MNSFINATFDSLKQESAWPSGLRLHSTNQEIGDSNPALGNFVFFSKVYFLSEGFVTFVQQSSDFEK